MHIVIGGGLIFFAFIMGVALIEMHASAVQLFFRNLFVVFFGGLGLVAVVAIGKAVFTRSSDAFQKSETERRERERVAKNIREANERMSLLRREFAAVQATSNEQFAADLLTGMSVPDYLTTPLTDATQEFYEEEKRAQRCYEHGELSDFQLSEGKDLDSLRMYLFYDRTSPNGRVWEVTRELRKLFYSLPKPEVTPGPLTTTYLHLAPAPLSVLETFVSFGHYGNDLYISRTPLAQVRMRIYEKRSQKALSDFEGTPAEAADFYLSGTPFLNVMKAPVALGFADEARFRHQWVVGDTGSGKTTFLSALIADDLKRVERNEASLFIMDSQNELIPDIARLAQFAPGGPLFGKLIYLEPDPDYPLALNIFDNDPSRYAGLSNKDRMILERGAMWMVEFFLSSLVKAEASPHQDIFLKYVIPALMAIPNATIFTFKELLESAPKGGKPPGYERYKHHFAKLRPDTQQWLAERMHSPELAVTRNAIRARLDGFTADPFFHDMFMHPRNKLDLFSELQSGKVILVNTMKGLLKSGTEPFGRYFIARLVQAMEERSLLAPGERLPVFAYIDEASDYIAEEPNIEELIDKARKQRMGFVFANQRESQITSPTVRDALSRAAIQCRGQAQGGGKPPIWKVSINRAEPVEVGVPNVRFQDMPRMSDIEFEGMMSEMRRNYSGAAPPGYGAYRPSGGTQQGSEDIIDAEYEVVEERLKITSRPDGDSDEHTKWG